MGAELFPALLVGLCSLGSGGMDGVSPIKPQTSKIPWEGCRALTLPTQQRPV